MHHLNSAHVSATLTASIVINALKDIMNSPIAMVSYFIKGLDLQFLTLSFPNDFSTYALHSCWSLLGPLEKIHISGTSWATEQCSNNFWVSNPSAIQWWRPIWNPDFFRIFRILPGFFPNFFPHRSTQKFLLGRKCQAYFFDLGLCLAARGKESF